jgi:acetyl esterase
LTVQSGVIERNTMWKRPRLDPFVETLERRFGVNNGVEVELAPRDQAQAPSEPIARREHARRADVNMVAVLGLSAPLVATEDHRVPVPDHPDARVRVYWPTTERPARTPPNGLPVLVYFFGGSFTLGGIDWVGLDLMFRARAAEAGIIVVAGEYSLAPEVQYPAQPEQCWSIFRWAVTHARELGGDPTTLAVGGASAGANLAAVVALMNRDRDRHPVRLQLLEVPVVDLRGRHLDSRAISRFLPTAVLRWISRPIVRDYLGKRRTAGVAREPYASPLLASDHADLPPAFILTAEVDPLRGDGEAYARALSTAGVPVTCMRYIGQNHGSGSYRNLNPAADDVHRHIIATLRTLHEPPVAYPDPHASFDRE